MKRFLMIIAFPPAFLIFWISLFFISKDKIRILEQEIAKLTS